MYVASGSGLYDQKPVVGYLDLRGKDLFACGIENVQ